MIIYRLFTEDINRKGIENIVTKKFTGYTIIPASGYWKGIKEKSLVVEIVGNKNDKIAVDKVAQSIKQTNKQQAVLIQSYNVNSKLV